MRNYIIKCSLLLFFLFLINIVNADNNFTEEIKKIDSQNVSSTDVVNILEKAIRSGKIINTLKVKELLNRASAEELSALEKSSKQIGAKQLNLLIDEVSQEIKKLRVFSEYHYIESTLIGAKPVIDVSCSRGEKQYLKDLNPERFHFDYPDLNLIYEPFYLNNFGNGLWGSNSVLGLEQDLILENNKSTNKDKSKQVIAKLYKVNTTEQLWQYKLKQKLFLRPRYRMWDQVYEESSLFPYNYKGRVFIRNSHRIFCFDALSGQLLWTFSPEKRFGREEELVHIEQNDSQRQSYLITVDKDRLYAQLANSLVGLDIASDSPKLIWQIPLGQYVLASKPYVLEDSLFICLISQRGEMWGVLLNRHNGVILWDSFVGLVTAICPASDLVTHDKTILYFISNRGLITAFDILSGNIIWIFEYEIRKYPLRDIWFLTEGIEAKTADFIKTPFDTSMISIIDNNVLFKPRDSKYIYLCDKLNGNIIWKILLDENIFPLGSDRNKLFLLNLKEKYLVSVDLISGAESKIKKICEGKFMGLINNSSIGCLFKIGSVVYNLIPREQPIITIMHNDSDTETWLKGIAGDGIYFTCQDENLFCFGKKNVLKKESNYLKSLEEEKVYFNSVINQETKEKINLEILNQYLKRDIIPADYYTKLSLLFKDTPNYQFLSLLSDKMCLYNDMRLLALNFLSAISQNGKLNFTNGNEKEKSFLMMPNEKSDSFILAEDEGLRIINIKNDSKFFPYFLVLKNDQLLCVKKIDGQIVWSKFIIGHRIQSDAKNNYLKNIAFSAAVYRNVIAIFDGVNFFGVNADTGNLIWYMPNEDFSLTELFNYHIILKKKNVTTLYDTIFSDENIVHFRRGILYFIEPITGYCYSRLNVEYHFISGMMQEGNFIVCCYLPDAKVELYGLKEGLKLKEIDIRNALQNEYVYRDRDKEYKVFEVLKKFKDFRFFLAFKYPYFYLQVPSGLWCFSFKGDYVAHKTKEFVEQITWQIDKIGNRIISFIPFWKILAWNDKLTEIEFEKYLSDKPYYNDTMEDIFLGEKKFLHKSLFLESQYLNSVDNKIIYLKKKEDGYYLIAIDSKDGKELWEVFVTDFYPVFRSISNSVVVNDKICFIFSLQKEFKAPTTNLRFTSDLGFIYSIFLAIETKTGKLIKRREFPIKVVIDPGGEYYLGLIDNLIIMNEYDICLKGERL